MSCSLGDACGTAVGEPAGIGIPGVCICGEAAGEGDAAGIFIPGVITCGVGDGSGLGLVVLLVGVRLRGAGLFLGVARLGFGLGFAAGLGMTCPSCCGNTLDVSANIKTSALSVRITILKLLDRFIFPPHGSAKRLWQFLRRINE